MAFHDNLNLGTTANDGTGDGLRTNLGKLQDNTKDNKQRIEDLNGNTPGVVSSNGVTILTPLDGSFGFGGTKTGSIKIKLPNTWSNTMLKLFIEIYDYGTNESISLILSGYTYTGAPSWANTTAIIIASSSNKNFTIRFGYEGTKCCVYVGELNSYWSYLKVAIVKTMLTHSNNAASAWLSGWEISLETTSFQNVSQTHTNNLPVAQ